MIRAGACVRATPTRTTLAPTSCFPATATRGLDYIGGQERAACLHSSLLMSFFLSIYLSFFLSFFLYFFLSFFCCCWAARFRPISASRRPRSRMHNSLIGLSSCTATRLRLRPKQASRRPWAPSCLSARPVSFSAHFFALPLPLLFALFYHFPLPFIFLLFFILLSLFLLLLLFSARCSAGMSSEDAFRGMFKRLAHMGADVYWHWTPEGWEWGHMSSKSAATAQALADAQASAKVDGGRQASSLFRSFSSLFFLLPWAGAG